MRLVSFFHRETGLLHDTQLMASDDEIVALNTPADHIAIDGFHDRLAKRVELTTGEVVDYQPPAPTADHEWNSTSKRWALSKSAVDRAELKSGARTRISHLEANVQPRAIREAQLSLPGSLKRLQDIDDEIADLRKHLA